MDHCWYQNKTEFCFRARVRMILFAGVGLASILLSCPCDGLAKSNPSVSEIGRLKGAQAKTYLTSKDAKAKESAILAIGRDKNYHDSDADLKKLAKNEGNLSIRAAAIQSLGSHLAGFDELKTILLSTSESLVVREAAASALALFPEVDAVNVLGSAYDQSDGELREHIGICLGGLRSRHPRKVEQILGGYSE